MVEFKNSIPRGVTLASVITLTAVLMVSAGTIFGGMLAPLPIVQYAEAHNDPAGCTTNGLGLSIGAFADAGATNALFAVADDMVGDTIYFKATMGDGPAASDCAYEGGTITIITPDGVPHDATPVGGIACIGGTAGGDAAPLTCDNQVTTQESAIISYVTSFADLDPENKWIATADLDSFSHFNPGDTLPAGANVDTEITLASTILTKEASDEKVAPGSEVTYTYFEENDGGALIFDAFVEDDSCAPVTFVGGDDGDTILEPGEIWEFTCTTELNETTTNTATGHGNVLLTAQGGLEDLFPFDSDEEASTTVTVFNPAIEITKDAPEKVAEDSEVTYTYAVTTGAGTSNIFGVVVTDDTCAPVNFTGGDDGDGVLEVGETWTYECTTTLSETTTNTATASGLDQLEGPVEDTAEATVTVFTPSILVTKDCEPDTQTAPGTISYTVVVTNDGIDATLTNISVDDNVHGHIGDIALLAPGEFVQFDFQADNLPAGTYTNTVTASGIDQLENPVEDSAEATCEVTGGGEGLTPGFWKNNADSFGAGAWVNHSPGDSFESIFGVDVTLNGKGKTTFEDPTLREALDASGGGINALARHAVAALLNINNPDVDYFMSEADLIQAVQDAINSGDPQQIEDLKNELDFNNNLGADISQHWPN